MFLNSPYERGNMIPYNSEALTHIWPLPICELYASLFPCFDPLSWFRTGSRLHCDVRCMWGQEWNRLRRVISGKLYIESKNCCLVGYCLHLSKLAFCSICPDTWDSLSVSSILNNLSRCQHDKWYWTKGSGDHFSWMDGCKPIDLTWRIPQQKRGRVANCRSVAWFGCSRRLRFIVLYLSRVCGTWSRICTPGECLWHIVCLVSLRNSVYGSGLQFV